MDQDLVRIGLLGCGNVGAPVVSLLEAHADVIRRCSGVRIEVAKVAVRNLSRERPV